MTQCAMNPMPEVLGAVPTGTTASDMLRAEDENTWHHLPLMTALTALAVKVGQARPLDALYPIVHLDCVHVKVRASSVVHNKTVYLIVCRSRDAHREVLGLWVAPNRERQVLASTGGNEFDLRDSKAPKSGVDTNQLEKIGDSLWAQWISNRLSRRKSCHAKSKSRQALRVESTSLTFKMRCLRFTSLRLSMKPDSHSAIFV
ncbi:hypothetical protein D5045_20320 [Verminephrobacter eiseniae]|nr:hypothetical protein [Verminephrobacter eiseniae]